jgi:hypothetical protein
MLRQPKPLTGLRRADVPKVLIFARNGAET